MLSLRYSPGKIWANYVLAMAAGIVVVILLMALWDRSVLAGGIGGLLGVGVLLFIGCVKRSSLKEPILVVDGRGITIGLPKFGTIPWSAIKSARITGLPWVTSARLIVEYSGQAPKFGFLEKFFWFVQTKQKGPAARVSIAAIELTDRPLSQVKAAIDVRGRATTN